MILALLERVRDRANQRPHPCLDRESVIRRSYLIGVAMLAYADGVLASGERALFLELAKAFGIEEAGALGILALAERPNEDTVMEIRRHLLDSRFKYYFILDLQIMAHQDDHLEDVEAEVLSRFCEILEIDGEDMSFLTGLADAVVEKDPEAKKRWANQFFLAKKEDNEDIEPDELAHYTQ